MEAPRPTERRHSLGCSALLWLHRIQSLVPCAAASVCVCVGGGLLAGLGQRSVMVLGFPGCLAHVALSLWPWAEEGTGGPEELWAFC